MPKNFSKLGAVMVAAVVCSLFIMIPAKAFYLEVPQFAKDAWKMLKSIQVSAQEGDNNYVAPPADSNVPPTNQEQPVAPAPQEQQIQFVR